MSIIIAKIFHKVLSKGDFCGFSCGMRVLRRLPHVLSSDCNYLTYSQLLEYYFGAKNTSILIRVYHFGSSSKFVK